MRCLNARLGAPAVLVLAATAFAAGCPASPPRLTVLLRCEAAATGQLSVAILPGTGGSPIDKIYDVKTVCGAGKLVFEHYRSEASVRFKIDRGDGHTGELVAQYGPDILRDPEGFFAVIKIADTPPFLSNDRI